MILEVSLTPGGGIFLNGTSGCLHPMLVPSSALGETFFLVFMARCISHRFWFTTGGTFSDPKGHEFLVLRIPTSPSAEPLVSHPQQKLYEGHTKALHIADANEMLAPATIASTLRQEQCSQTSPMAKKVAWGTQKTKEVAFQAFYWINEYSHSIHQGAQA